MFVYMSRHGLRRLPLVTLLLLGMNVHGQEWSTADLKPLVIGCRDLPLHAGPAVTLTVDKAWVDENSSLFADLLVTNSWESAIRLPRRNICRRYWGVQIDPIPRYEEERPLLMCGGAIAELYEPCDTLGMPGDPREMLLAEEDIVTIAPGRTVLLRGVYLDYFVPEDREHKVRSFEVTYTGWSKIEVALLPAKLAEYKTALAEASARQCSLYDGALGGHGQFLIPERPKPGPEETIVIITQPWRD
jgi:hypothetical protein